jgi:hypothetical protein
VSDQRVERAAKKFRREMQDLGVGVSMQVAGGEMVEVVAPPNGKEAAMAVIEQASQLSLEVDHDVGLFITGSLAIAGTLMVRQDLNDGDRLRVQVVDANGEVVANAAAKIVHVGFPLKEQNGSYWTERAHKAKITDQ